MNHGYRQRGGYDAEGVADAFGQRQSLAGKCKSIIRISEQPIGLRTKVARASARIMPAVEPPEKMVPLGIIKPAPRFAMLASGCRIASKQTCCPGAVMRLQTQFVVRVGGGQLLQPV